MTLARARTAAAHPARCQAAPGPSVGSSCFRRKCFSLLGPGGKGVSVWPESFGGLVTVSSWVNCEGRAWPLGAVTCRSPSLLPEPRDCAARAARPCSPPRGSGKTPQFLSLPRGGARLSGIAARRGCHLLAAPDARDPCPRSPRSPGPSPGAGPAGVRPAGGRFLQCRPSRTRLARLGHVLLSCPTRTPEKKGQPSHGWAPLHGTRASLGFAEETNIRFRYFGSPKQGAGARCLPLQIVLELLEVSCGLGENEQVNTSSRAPAPGEAGFGWLSAASAFCPGGRTSSFGGYSDRKTTIF